VVSPRMQLLYVHARETKLLRARLVGNGTLIGPDWRTSAIDSPPRRPTDRGSMPENWDADVYRRRAEGWRARADSLAEGPEKETCVELAEGYARLAHLIAARESVSVTSNEAERSDPGKTAVTSSVTFCVVCVDNTIVSHTGSLDSAIRLACELERDGHTVMRIDQGVSTALEEENLRMAIGGKASL
jgi:hypothetical protein